MIVQLLYANTTEFRQIDHDEKLKRDIYNTKVLREKWSSLLVKNDSVYYHEDGLESPFEELVTN